MHYFYFFISTALESMCVPPAKGGFENMELEYSRLYKKTKRRGKCGNWSSVRRAFPIIIVGQLFSQGAVAKQYKRFVKKNEKKNDKRARTTTTTRRHCNYLAASTRRLNVVFWFHRTLAFHNGASLRDFVSYSWCSDLSSQATMARSDAAG